MRNLITIVTLVVIILVSLVSCNTTPTETATIHTFKGINETNGELITHITAPCNPQVGQEVQVAKLANGRWVMLPNYYTIDSTTVTVTVTGVGKGTEVYTYK